MIVLQLVDVGAVGARPSIERGSWRPAPGQVLASAAQARPQRIFTNRVGMWPGRRRSRRLDRISPES